MGDGSPVQLVLVVTDALSEEIIGPGLGCLSVLLSEAVGEVESLFTIGFGLGFNGLCGEEDGEGGYEVKFHSLINLFFKL